MSTCYYQKDYLILVIEPCEAGKYANKAEVPGCHDCPEDYWSDAGNSLATCTECPAGKGVDSGSGTSESACTWSKLI